MCFRLRRVRCSVRPACKGAATKMGATSVVAARPHSFNRLRTCTKAVSARCHVRNVMVRRQLLRTRRVKWAAEKGRPRAHRSRSTLSLVPHPPRAILSSLLDHATCSLHRHDSTSRHLTVRRTRDDDSGRKRGAVQCRTSDGGCGRTACSCSTSIGSGATRSGPFSACSELQWRARSARVRARTAAVDA